MSSETINAYLSDIQKIISFLETQKRETIPAKVSVNDLKDFLIWINGLGISTKSQARIISGLKAFYKYLVREDILDNNPVDLIELPRLERKLPEILTIEEIISIINAVDRSAKNGERNRAILEIMYSCGLRVSEVCNLLISNLFFDDDFIKVTGKGDKERLVPIGNTAKKQINIYKNEIRNHQFIDKTAEDTLFLNQRGNKISRVMIFNIVKTNTQRAGVSKNVSPHTFRHSFATHLIEGGADLRAVQEMLGHESITTTEIYTHLDKNFLRSNILDFHPLNKK